MLDQYRIADVKLHRSLSTHTHIHTQHQFIVLYGGSSNIIVQMTRDSTPLKTLSSSLSDNGACTPHYTAT